METLGKESELIMMGTELLCASLAHTLSLSLCLVSGWELRATMRAILPPRNLTSIPIQICPGDPPNTEDSELPDTTAHHLKFRVMPMKKITQTLDKL